ncbi:MAG: peptidoglycan-binding domain-containing protein [Pseudomonadota bacterium]
MADELPLLKWGSKGEYVNILQEALNAHTKKLTTQLVVDGVFGRLTYAAVKLFQSENGLNDDGVVGPKTWGEIEKRIGKIGQKGRKGPPLPPLSGYPVQRTPDDCGYFAHYALAEANARKSTSISFSDQQVFDARDRFLRATGRSGHVYLAPVFVKEYMDICGQSGFRQLYAKSHFEKTNDTRTIANYLYNILGNSGICMVLNTFKGSSAEGHWIAVITTHNTKDNTYFFVYDSSCYIPRSVYQEPKSDITVCWVPWHPFATYLKGCAVGSITVRQ